MNRGFADDWLNSSSHRERVMGHIEQIARGGEVCVFGVGNCNDLDLERLASLFSEVHLVDLDPEALERSRERQGAQAKTKITLHGGVDCSGMLDHLDDWGERFPERRDLAQSAVAAAEGIVRGLGQTFSVVVSACLLSQLAVPFQRAWVTSRVNWADLLSTINAVHLATLTGSSKPGGHGLIVFDTSSSRDTPALAELHNRSTEELEEFVAEARASGGLDLRPNPKELVRQLLSPGLRSLVAQPELSSPWLWNTGPHTRLVYSLTFIHPLG
jgi:hypothetical protein